MDCQRTLFPALIFLSVCCASPQAQQTRALMQAPIVPASDAIFGSVVYANGKLTKSPVTDADWDRLEQHAATLLDAALRLRKLAPKEADPSTWLRQSDALAEASQAAVDASSSHSLDAVLDAGSRIYDACTACHAAYVKND